MAKDCTYTWNGVEWILTADNSGGGNCVCPAAHWGPHPADIGGRHTMTTKALCKGPSTPDLTELAAFAAIPGDKPNPPVVPAFLPNGKPNFPTPNHKMKSDKFNTLSKEWDKVMKEQMEKEGIEVGPKPKPS
jgi:hypothetical protein